MMTTSTTPRLAHYIEDPKAFLMSAPPPQNSASLTAAEFEQATTSQSHPLHHPSPHSSHQHPQGVTSEPQQIKDLSTKFDVQQVPNCRMRGDSGLLPDWTTSPPFSCTSGFLPNFGSTSIGKRFSLEEEDYDDDKTPMNSYKADSILDNFQPSNASSCRDSGTESIDTYDSADDCTAILTSLSGSLDQSSQSQFHTDKVKVLHFFATDKSKSSFLPGRQRTAPKFVAEEAMKTCLETGDIGNEEIQSDGESTLSESSLSPTGDDDSQRITPELVVAAIDKKIKEQKQLLKNKKKKKVQRQRVVTKDDVAGDDEDSDNDSSSPSPTQAQAPTQCSEPVQKPDDLPALEIRDENKNLVPIVEVEESSTDDEFGESGRIPLIRSTSLKTGKTPPGTPRTKKIVRFADAMGLDLESVRTIADDVPYVPPVAAFKGLALEDDDIKWIYGQRASIPTTSSGNGNGLHIQTLAPPSGHLSPTNSKPALRMLFCQPISDPGPFMERVRNFKVCLENCMVAGPHGPTDMFDLTCVIRVANLGFEKDVTLRYTSNEWLTWTDVAASYVPHSCDGFSDKFTCMFHIAVNSNGHQSMMPGQRLLFAVKYLANGTDEFWDNNMGLNYALIYQRS